MGGRGGTLVDAPPGIDDWYANVFVVERRKCLLLAHADTLFSVLDTNVRVPQFDDLGSTLQRSSSTRSPLKARRHCARPDRPVRGAGR
jgi:hypothetical protein